MLSGPFVFTICRAGAELALKAEVARLHPGWRFAYSRPGFVTFRTEAHVAADFPFDFVFARAAGVSMGAAASDEEILAAAQRLRAETGRPLRLHVFARGVADPEEEEVTEVSAPLLAELRARLVGAAPPGTFAPPGPPRAGDLVLDVILGEGEAPWLGCHVHGDSHSPHPGGRVELTLPTEAPSRAWLKIEEALRWSGLPLRAGEVALELGSAPGGTSWALLDRGLTVIGLDPGDMDPRVLARPSFSHLKMTLGDLRREHLPRRIDWLLLDVNLAPQVALHQTRRIISMLRSTLRGVILTLKLNDERWKSAAEVPALCKRVAGMGLSNVRATHLAANRREICLVASVPKGSTRRPGRRSIH
jgi:23S rRNA (cytidine2498-2'-O)-methyltransferase